MRYRLSIAASVALLATLSGCSKPEPAAEATATPEAAPAAAATWTPALPTPGAYEVTSLDGKPVSKVTIAADYGYQVIPATGANEAGVVKLADGKVCFDPSGKEKPTRCYTESARAADGSFTATDEKGVTENIKPVAN